MESIFLKMSAKGLRVVALAVNRGGPDILRAAEIGDLTFVCFLGMKDTLRPEATAAIKKILSANIRLVMITGDHENTALAIAKEAGIYRSGDTILTGKNIEELTGESLREKISACSVFARVTPDHKLRIIKAYKDRGEIIAMTGDGVNDAPSLVAADLGVAMGKIGAEVAKEAADIVLLDDNLANVVSAVEEGRNIYKTIKKVVLYLFSTSAGEVLTIAGALAFSLPLPLLPAQIIWLNFVTDGFLDVALAMGPKEAGLLSEKFKRPNKWIVDKLMVERIILMALPMALGALWLFQASWQNNFSRALTLALTTLAVFQWFNAWNCRSDNDSVFGAGFFSNKFLVGATAIVILLQIGAVYLPIMNTVLRTTPLTAFEWAIAATIAFSVVVIEEFRKFVWRKSSAISHRL